jgi:hypothetical protein
MPIYCEIAQFRAGSSTSVASSVTMPMITKARVPKATILSSRDLALEPGDFSRHSSRVDPSLGEDTIIDWAGPGLATAGDAQCRNRVDVALVVDSVPGVANRIGSSRLAKFVRYPLADV